MATVDKLTDAEVDDVLYRFDQTDPALQPRIVAELVLTNARLAALNAELRKALDSWQERLRVVVDAKDAGLLTELLDQELTTNAGLREENERLRGHYSELIQRRDEVAELANENERLRTALEGMVKGCRFCSGNGVEEEYSADYSELHRGPCPACSEARDALTAASPTTPPPS